MHGLPWLFNLVVRNIVAALPSDTSKKLKFISGFHHEELSLNKVTSNFTKITDLNNNKLKKQQEAETRTRLAIEEFIDRDNLPSFLGGTATLNYRIVPKNSISMHKFYSSTFNLSEKETDKLLKPFQKVIDDSQTTFKTFKEQNFEFEFNLDDISKEYAKHIRL